VKPSIICVSAASWNPECCGRGEQLRRALKSVMSLTLALSEAILTSGLPKSGH
jgi:hypothetical protein